MFGSDGDTLTPKLKGDADPSRSKKTNHYAMVRAPTVQHGIDDTGESLMSRGTDLCFHDLREEVK